MCEGNYDTEGDKINPELDERKIPPASFISTCEFAMVNIYRNNRPEQIVANPSCRILLSLSSFCDSLSK